MKKKKSRFNNHKAKTNRSITILVFGALIISCLIALIQTNSSKEKQKKNSLNSLNEVTLTLQENDEVIRNVTNEYNSLNQNTIRSLSFMLKMLIFSMKI